MKGRESHVLLLWRWLKGATYRIIESWRATIWRIYVFVEWWNFFMRWNTKHKRKLSFSNICKVQRLKSNTNFVACLKCLKIFFEVKRQQCARWFRHTRLRRSAVFWLRNASSYCPIENDIVWDCFVWSRRHRFIQNSIGTRKSTRFSSIFLQLCQTRQVGQQINSTTDWVQRRQKIYYPRRN